MKTNLFLLTLGILILTSACSLYTISSEETSLNLYPQKSSINDVVYLETVNRPFELIGYATVNAERNQKINEIIEKLRYEAAILGGDAITDITQNFGNGTWVQIRPKLFKNSNVRSNFVAKVIVLK